MTKKKLLEMLDSGMHLATSEEKVIIDKIKEALYWFEDNIQINGLDSIENFKKNGGFLRSRMDPDFSERCIERELEQILSQLHLWIKHYSYNVELDVIEKMNKGSQVALNIFLVFIAILAICSLAFAILHFCLGDKIFNGRGDNIAEVFGLFDFALGAAGFIWERKDDMKKRSKQKKMETAIEAGDTQKFVTIMRQEVKNINQKAGHHSVQIIGDGNEVYNGFLLR